MIPVNLADLHLPQVFDSYSSDVCRYIHETTEDKHIVDSETARVSGFVSLTFGQSEDSASPFRTRPGIHIRSFRLIMR